MDKIEIPPEQLADLKEKAQKATPGPWAKVDDHNIFTSDFRPSHQLAPAAGKVKHCLTARA